MNPIEPANLTQEMLGTPSEPCVMVIFGAGGDLTKRKLIPALYNLSKGNLLPQQFAIVGISREQSSTDDFRARTTEEIKQFSTTRAISAIRRSMPSWASCWLRSIKSKRRAAIVFSISPPAPRFSLLS